MAVEGRHFARKFGCMHLACLFLTAINKVHAHAYSYSEDASHSYSYHVALIGCMQMSSYWGSGTAVGKRFSPAATSGGALKHCIALFQGPTLHPRIRNQMLGFLSFFSTTMSHTSDFWLDYRGRLRCTNQTSAESVKIASKTDELWGARHAATIALAHR